MKICQLTRNADTGRMEADGYVLHAQDPVCVMIPDEQISLRLWQDPRIHYDTKQHRWYLEEVFDPYRDIWNGFWTYTRLLYDEGQDRWYLEAYPLFQVSGLFIKF